MEEKRNEKPVEVKSLAEEIAEYNRKIEQSIEKLNEWKTALFNLQEDFVGKLRNRTLAMKIQ